MRIGVEIPELGDGRLLEEATIFNFSMEVELPALNGYIMQLTKLLK